MSNNELELERMRLTARLKATEVTPFPNFKRGAKSTCLICGCPITRYSDRPGDFEHCSP